MKKKDMTMVGIKPRIYSSYSLQIMLLTHLIKLYPNLYCFIRKLFISPLFKLDVHSSIKSPWIHGLCSWKIDVFNHMSWYSFPQRLLKDFLPKIKKNKFQEYQI